jgi:hypothetical protein
MQVRILRWLATPAGIAIACAAGFWLYLETAFGIGLDAGLRCAFGGKEPGTCITTSETARFWIWSVASGALSGVASVLLAVLAAPQHRRKVWLIAAIVPPIAWLWFWDWDLNDSTAVVLMLSSLAGGFISRPFLSRLVPGMTPRPAGSAS